MSKKLKEKEIALDLNIQSNISSPPLSVGIDVGKTKLDLAIAFSDGNKAVANIGNTEKIMSFYYKKNSWLLPEQAFCALHRKVSKKASLFGFSLVGT